MIICLTAVDSSSCSSWTLHFVHNRQSRLRWLNIINRNSVVTKLLNENERILFDHCTCFSNRQLSERLSSLLTILMSYLIYIILESLTDNSRRISAICAGNIRLWAQRLL